MLMTLVAKERMRESVAHITKIRGYYITIGGKCIKRFQYHYGAFKLQKKKKKGHVTV